MISPRLKVEDSYPLTVVVEDKKNNLSVGRPIYLTVQTLQDDFPGGLLAQVLPSDPDTSGQGSDGKHDTVTSQVRIDFHKFSEAAVEQMVILRLETTQADQVANVLAGDDSVQLLSLSQHN